MKKNIQMNHKCKIIEFFYDFCFKNQAIQFQFVYTPKYDISCPILTKSDPGFLYKRTRVYKILPIL